MMVTVDGCVQIRTIRKWRADGRPEGADMKIVAHEPLPDIDVSFAAGNHDQRTSLMGRQRHFDPLTS